MAFMGIPPHVAEIKPDLDPAIVREAAQHRIGVRIRPMVGDAGIIMPMFIPTVPAQTPAMPGVPVEVFRIGRSSTTKSSDTIAATTTGDQHEIISMLPVTGKPL
jgi:hypothetical protein